ncbi:Transcriptional regulator [Aspergillus sp. HF37]|nr:Transcriptional regulator [Aspergillus sp. HF37]
MYLRAIHAETNLQALQTFVHNNPLGILTTAIKSSSPEHPLIQSSHIPFVLDVPSGSCSSSTPESESPGILRGHLARQNPQAQVLMEAVAKAQEKRQGQGQDTAPHELELDDEILVLFNGPLHHYVTPKFYTQTKPESGKVVPTWNYAAVQAYGRARIFCDSKAEATSRYLQTQTEDLTRLSEGGVMGYATDAGEAGDGQKQKAWEVGDAPRNYIEIMKKNIIGIEIRLDKLQGKCKMSQEMGAGDRDGVVAGFAGLGTDVGDGMSKTVKERGELKDQAK